ncbi:hypothetical protein E4U25_007507 [Claviceps purpurea]|nr:hypothetical protein E4U27_007896 [Claviceps purpurea]KAG6240725.1 hypothetical protein E4U25_007507 [Claviceps purpurea]KAG6270569.1 hypothetical protein E4U49_005324 [Claviceps purpurea]
MSLECGLERFVDPTGGGEVTLSAGSENPHYYTVIPRVTLLLCASITNFFCRIVNSRQHHSVVPAQQQHSRHNPSSILSSPPITHSAIHAHVHVHQPLPLAMSRASKLTLAGTCLATTGIVALVHFQQKWEKAAMHEGVVRDMEQQRIKRERQLDFDMQRELEAQYKQHQTVRDSTIDAADSKGEGVPALPPR